MSTTVSLLRGTLNNLPENTGMLDQPTGNRLTLPAKHTQAPTRPTTDYWGDDVRTHPADMLLVAFKRWCARIQKGVPNGTVAGEFSKITLDSEVYLTYHAPRRSGVRPHPAPTGRPFKRFL